MAAKNRLSAAAVKSAPIGKHCDGGGLWLVKRADGGAQWVLRITIHGRRREMGLGALPDVGLAAARDIAERWRAVAASGRDPIKERDRERREAARSDNTLRVMALAAFEALKGKLRGDGKAGRWFSPLELHVLPKLGKVPVQDIDQRDIRDTLAPIWNTKNPTAKKALDRLSIVFRHAAAEGLDVDLQVTALAKQLLGATSHETKHIPAMPWQEVPTFYESLAEPTLTHLALRFLMLTGMRTKPVRFLRLEHIDGDVWTIPADLMKGRKGKTKDFRVPLSSEAIAVIELAKPFARDGYLFPSVRKGVISDATMARLMERRGLEARPHGFRTSLRSWLADNSKAPHEVQEMMIAHLTDNKVVRTYRRNDFLKQRRALAERWADYLTGGTGNVVQLTEVA